ncbi:MULTISPECIES: hypothetical protein [Flavobacteriaceae]|uniref:Restriction endonuclease n=1 Tax=Autumnicola edwardsiae TaxID=3075594 RepID=A0ABU3CYQ5_9FLAO|nr:MULTISPECIES: hypothetical protein [Flavobacteriaceae]MDT0651327.1 restriction endonuclease [Zunongwangia sp. F297]|tara:strand:+ start:7943 stop:9382 length:1440 start_codon:yes stop_codon:yes gene_type:complete
MGKWLYNILKEGELKDNSSYQAVDGMFSNHFQNMHTPLWFKRNYRTHARQYDERIWDFLLNISLSSSEALKKLTNTQFINEGLYEHNSSDPFINLKGRDARNFHLSTGNIVGFAKAGDYSIQISSRFGDDFLKYIISDADGFLEIQDFGGEKKDYNGFEWLLIYLWKIKLKKAFRLGIPKSYISKTERTTRVKGQIDPLSFYLSRDAKYKCTYREHSYINEVTGLIDAAFDKLGTQSFLSDMHPLKLAFKTALEGKKYSKQQLYNTKAFTNPFYLEYNEVIDLSRKILKDEISSFGENSDTSAFLFDVSMLFEYFIHKLLLRNGFAIESKSKEIKIPTGQPGYRNLEPDIVFEDNGHTYVFDVKYKNFDGRFGVKREDLFQLHTYIGQWGNKRQIKGCGFIYPLKEEKFNQMFSAGEGITTQSLEIMDNEIPFHIIFLKIPEGDGKDFYSKMKESSEKFIRNMQSVLQKPDLKQLRKVS